MSRIAYVAGQYLPHRQAAVHIEDRGYQFADGVYEVIAVVGGHLVDEEPHLTRLHRSLAELRIALPMGDARAEDRACARSSAATASIPASSICRSPAARRPATMPFRKPRSRRWW